MLILNTNICNSENFITILTLLRRFIYLLLVVIVVALIIASLVSLVKALTSKEDEIKNRFKTLMTRLVGLVLVLLVPAIVNLVIGIVDIDRNSSCTASIVTTLFNTPIKESELVLNDDYCDGSTLVSATEEEVEIYRDTDIIFYIEEKPYYCLGGYFE